MKKNEHEIIQVHLTEGELKKIEAYKESNPEKFSELLENLSTKSNEHNSIKSNSNESSPEKNEVNENKKIVQVEHRSHEKAAEFLETLENVINKQENAEEILDKLYTEIREMGGMNGNPDYFDWISSAIKRCVDTNYNREEYKEFKLIKFLEDNYMCFYCEDENQQKVREMIFKKEIEYAHNNVDENLKNILGDLYHDYLESQI